MAAGKLSEINVTPLVDVLLVLLIIFMVTTAAAEQQRLEQKKQESVQKKTESLITLNLPVTPDNDYLADPDTPKLVVVIDQNLRVYVVRGLSTISGSTTPVADCYPVKNDPSQWRVDSVCLSQISIKLGKNQRMLKEGLYLEADADVPYGFVSAVLQSFRGAGLQSVDIVTDPHFKDMLEAAP